MNGRCVKCMKIQNKAPIPAARNLARKHSGKNQMPAIAMAVLCLTTPAWAITRSWTHASSQYWSDPANWNPEGVPQNGDDLSFFDTFIILGPSPMVNDMTDLVVHNMWFGLNG